MMNTYKTRPGQALTAGRTRQTARPGPDIGALASGAAPTVEQMGSRVDLPGEIREKMESSFGADFSNVRLYESQTVADAGAEAVTQGNNIAFAPGKLDLTSTAGQALLGHELSHVVSQARGESAGQGFLNDAHLEAQADRQGMMAARGESVYAGPVSPMGVSSAASAAGPMQAKKKSKEEKAREKEMGRYQEMGELYNAVANATANRGEAEFGSTSHTDNIRDAAESATDPNFNDFANGLMFTANVMQGGSMSYMGNAYWNRFGSDSLNAMRRGIMGEPDENGQTPADPLEAYDTAMAQGLGGIRDLQRRRRG